MLLLMGAPGCIVADPPVFEEAQKTPPFLDLTNAHPPTTAIVTSPENATLAFSVPVRSEDAGDDLIATLFLDYPDPATTANFDRLEASTFDEVRSIDVQWTVQARQGRRCQQLTLVVTHVSNLDGNRPKDPDDTAFATWWVEIEDDANIGASPTLGECSIGGVF